MDHQLWIHSQDLDFMTAAIVLICSPTTQSPASYTSHRPPTLLLNAHNYLPTALQLYFTCCILPGVLTRSLFELKRQKQFGEQNISGVQSEQCTKSDQNLLLCAGRSRRRQGRMQAFLRHQYTSTPIHHPPVHHPPEHHWLRVSKEGPAVQF